MKDVYAQLQGRIKEGTVLQGRYRVGKAIGAGAYGMIFSAIDDVTGEQVAIKAIPPAHNESSRTAHGRFQREMVVIRNLVHGNIIAIYDWGETEDNFIFMVLEYIDGETLDAVVRHCPLPLEQAIDVTRQIANALEVAHRNGVIHRDLKPANVMLSPRREGGFAVKVLDFGMAKLLDGLEGESIVELTREGMAVGTPRYIAPEQARGQPIGPAADLYALGLLLYEMVTGAQAVKANSVQGAVTAHVSSKPLDLPELMEADPAIHPIILKLLEKDVDKRFQSSAELLHALNSLDKEPPHLPSMSGPPPVVGVLAVMAQPKPVPSQDGASLEIDYDAFKAHAPADQDPLVRRQAASKGPWFRLPETFLELAETVFALVIAPISFILFTAHFFQYSLELRYALGLGAPAIALGWSLIAHSDDWRFSFWRLLWCLSLVAIFIAHLLGPSLLAQELLRNPAWFLLPLGEGPFVTLLSDMVVFFARHYAWLIQALWPFHDPTLALTDIGSLPRA